MLQDNARFRLINCLAGSLMLHALFLSFTQQTFWGSRGLLLRPGALVFSEPLTVILADKEPPSALAPPSAMVLQAPGKPGAGAASPAKPKESASNRKQALSRMPEMIDKPPAAMEIGQDIKGEVVFRLSIDRFGKAKLVQRVRSNLPREIEGRLALQLYRSKYRPGEIGGMPVDSEMTVDLKLDSSGWLTDKLPVLRQGKPSSGSL